jgi:Lar family restriction alleviation protein
MSKKAFIPCPFCGWDDFNEKTDTSHTIACGGGVLSCQVICKGCGASGPKTRKDDKGAVTVWNRRVEK